MLMILLVGVVLTTVCVPGRCAVTQRTDKCIEDIDVSDLIQDLKEYINNGIESVVKELEQNSTKTNEAFKTQVEMKLKESNDKFKKEMEEMNTKYMSTQKRELKLQNTTLQIQQKLNAATNRVALTACNSNGPRLNSGVVIPFQNILHSYGIQDKSSFTNTGIFTCEQEGLYLVSVNLVENGSGSHFNVFLNGSNLRRCFASADTAWQESSCTTVIQLNVHDKLSVKTASNIDLTNVYTCLTVVKIM